MITTATPATETRSRFPISMPRTLGLARWNAVLLLRNKLAASYAIVIPILPFAFLLTGERGNPGVGAMAVISCLTMVMLFPVYYNVLSQFVTRRDELVLKRLRTGAARDPEILAAMALPGMMVAVLIALLAIPVAMAFGQSAPVNPLLYLVTVLVGVVLFAVLAFWTAALTKNAEAAQLTSMPVITLALVGQLGSVFPDNVQRWIDLTPGGALTDLVRITWFGFGGDDAVSTLDFADTWSAAGIPLLVLVIWIGLAEWYRKRTMRWEPRG